MKTMKKSNEIESQKVNKYVNQLIKSHYNLSKHFWSDVDSMNRWKKNSQIHFITFDCQAFFSFCIETGMVHETEAKERKKYQRKWNFHRENVKTCQKKHHLCEVHCSVDYNMQTNKTDNIKFEFLFLLFVTSTTTLRCTDALDNGKLLGINFINGKNSIFFTVSFSDALLLEKSQKKIIKAILKWKCCFWVSVYFFFLLWFSFCRFYL